MRMLHFFGLCVFVLFFVGYVMMVVLHGFGCEFVYIVFVFDLVYVSMVVVIVVGVVGIVVVVVVNVGVMVVLLRYCWCVQHVIGWLVDLLQNVLLWLGLY